MTDITISQNQEASGNSTNLAQSTLVTNFNIPPYYDDYSANKQYYRILFKPGYAVQARELTQMQTMLQSQIARFGRHVFKEGSIVLPGAFTIRTATNGTLDRGPGNPIDYVKIGLLDNSNNAVDVNTFLQQTVRGATSNITAYVVDVLPSDGTTQNTNTLYISYLSAQSGNSSVRTFQEGEVLTSNVGTAIVMTSANTSNVTGKASWLQIEEGVFFAKEHFIHFPTQSVVLDRYNPLPTCKVGFYVNEEIISAASDSSLLDPALGSSNYSAPGADRLKLISQLEVVNIDDTAGPPNFVPVLTIKDGIIQTIREKTEYNILGDVMATRTNDEAGDFVIRGLTAQISEHLKIDSPVPNNGRYPASGNPAGNSQLLVATIDPGVGYVKGYGVQKFDRTDIEFSKPTEFNNVSSQLAVTTMGQYVRVNEFVGSWELNRGNRVYFYDVPQRRIRNNGVTTGQKWSVTAQTGNNIGSAIVTSVQYVEGTPGYDAIYNIYLTDIRMTGSNSFSNVASLYLYSTPYASSGADILGVDADKESTGNTTLYDMVDAPLLYYVGNDWTKTVKDTLGADKTIYYFNQTVGISTTINMANNGTITPALSLGTNKFLPYGNTTLSGLADASSLRDFIITMGQSFNIGPLWNASVSASGNTINGSNTFFTHLNVGDKIEIGGLSNTWYITAIANNTSMTLSNTVPASVTANLIFKAYKTGDIIDMTGVGVNSGAQRTINTTPTSFTVDMKETFPTTPAVTISYKVGSTQTPAASKTLRASRYVKINCGTSGTTGPFSLGFADVFRINKVVMKSGSAPTSLNDGTDVTKYFRLDNGQRDTMYDLASIRKSGGLTLTSSDYLLINFDYFEPNFSGAGAFFTVDSYPVNDVSPSSSEIRTEEIPVYISPSSGLRYDLKNQLDFRPVKSPTATDSTTVGGASTSPSGESTTFISSGGNINFPIPNSQLIYDYSYYLGRRDIVCVNKDGSIVVVEGTPSEFPVAPIPTDNQMIIAIINVTPYPSISPAYGNILGRKDLAITVRKASNRVYTMRDIGVLDQRISNLEKYTSLTLLEKSALNLQVLDDGGVNRFKNGIFVDTFRDSSLSAAGIDVDYRIANDPLELSIRPLFSTESVGYEYISGSGVTVCNNNIVILNYTEVEQYNQPRVTDTRLLEKGTFFFQGSMTLLPKEDVWVDVTQAPDEFVEITATDALLDVNVSGPDTFDQTASITKNLINTEWGNWQATVTGYNLYRGEGASKTFVGTYSTAEEARRVASTWTTASGGGVATLETVYNNTRLGTDYFANFSSDQGAGSNKLISTSSIPYIRPQKIAVKVVNLKAFSKMNAFFDGVNVTEYCTPLTEDQYTTYIGGGVLQEVNGAFPIEGDDLIVDEYGALYFLFRIPSEPGAPKFRTGQRKLVVIDNTNLDANSLDLTEDTSTTAVGVFFAEGTSQTLQRTVYSTKGYLVTTGPTSESYTSKTEQVLPNTWKPPAKSHCCFDPEAKVLMADYTYKAIKDIQIGDKVIGDNGVINTVLANKTIGVGKRKMLRLKGSSFYTTDDHLFLTKKGWKTWRPDVVIRDVDSSNWKLLIGENRTRGIDKDDLLKKIEITENGIVDKFVPVEFEVYDFDPDFIVHDLTLDGNMSYIVEDYVVHNCCVAYSVLIRAPDDEEGIFCTGFNFYVARKSQTRGLHFSIRALDEAGQVTSDVIPGTEVRLENSEIPVSNTGADNPTQVRFESPVFLFNKKAYAFVIHSDSPNAFDVDPDTQIWVSRLGQVDKITGETITNREGTGQFWQTTNNLNWYEVGDVDLKMEIYRANFTPTTTSFVIGNKPIEKFHLVDQTLSFKSLIGEHFTTGDRITLSGVTGTVSVGDRITGNSSASNANSAVIASLGSNRYQMSNTRYIVGEGFVAYNANNTVVATGNIAAISNSTAALSYIDESQSSIYSEWAKSTGGFTANQVLTLIGSGGSAYRANIEFISNFKYSVVSLQPKVLDFVKTHISYEMNTYDLDSTSASGYTRINDQDTHYFGEQKQIYGRSYEVENLSGDRSNKLRVTFNTISNYVSPVLDLDHTHTIFIENLINSNTYGEGIVYTSAGNGTIDLNYSGNTASSGGYALNKYISQTITLAEGQDAEDLMVILSNYRPPGTDVLVYAKIKNADDGDTFASKNWIRMVKQGAGDSTYSSLSNRNNFKEFTYEMPVDLKTGPYGAIQYTNSSGSKFTSFKYYAIKIVLVADSPAIVPRASDLRVLALQM